MVKNHNGFDLLRLLLAAGVLINHGIMIGGYTLIDPLDAFSKGQSSLADLSVMGFFTLSGFLITKSFDRAKSVPLFASHRLLRIAPGFLASLLIVGFIIAPVIFVISGGSLVNYSFSGQNSAASFFYRNMFFNLRQWSINGVLDRSAYQGALNGSLWSLFPEIQCYFFTLISGSLGLFNRNKIALLIVTVVILFFFAIHFNFSKTYGPTILILNNGFKLYASYLAGTVLYVFHDKLAVDKRGTAFLFLFTLMLIKFGGFNIVSPLLIAMVLINSFQFFECKIRYDISFGIYIYGFPLQHLIYVIFGQHLNYFCFVSLSILFAAAMGLFSFLFIERPFIRLRKYTDPLMTSFADR